MIVFPNQKTTIQKMQVNTFYFIGNFPKTSGKFEKLPSTVRKHTICDRFLTGTCIPYIT